MNPSSRRPVTLLICALGGEGGGVLAEWLVETARTCGYSAQSTSIPGVAQRTGSTTYYFEVFPVPLSELGGRKPVFSLYPVPGALDALVSSELLETARQVSNGMPSAERTLIITSSARTLTTAEKMQLADGRAPADALLQLSRANSRAMRVFDMGATAQEAGTVLSAVLFGAVAGSGMLPFPRTAFEQTIRGSARGVDASLAGFALAFERVQGAGTTQSAAPLRPDAKHAPAWAMAFPPATREMLALGHARVVEYQDGGYGQLYLDRMQRILAADAAGDPSCALDHAATREAARYLALWMAFDDIVRVAQLKSRSDRFARVRREVRAGADELLRIHDHFKPGAPEVAALLPSRLAAALIRWDRRRREDGRQPLALPLKLGAHTLTGLLALRVLGSLKWLRRKGSRFAQEQAMIEHWVSAIEGGARRSAQLGLELALCGRLIKGYGATNDRGRENLLHILEQFAGGGAPQDPQAEAAAIRSVREAALADDAGKAFDQALTRHGAAMRPVRAQPVLWVKKPRNVHAAR